MARVEGVVLTLSSGVRRAVGGFHPDHRVGVRVGVRIRARVRVGVGVRVRSLGWLPSVAVG